MYNWRMARFIIALIWLGAAISIWLIWHAFGVRSWHLAAALATSYFSFWGIYFAASKLSRRKKSQRLLATTIMGLVLLMMFELAALANIIDYRQTLGRIADPDRRPWSNPANHLDDLLLHIHRPNQRHQGSVSGNFARHAKLPDAHRYPFDVQYDHRGFRNNEPFTAAEVIVIGDSFVEAALVSFDATISTQLSKELSQSVCNLGQSGYGPQQELEVLKRFGVPLAPKTCVWVFFEGNDLSDAAEYKKRVAQWTDFMVQRDRFWNRSFTRNALAAIPKLVTRPRPNEDLRKRVATVNGERAFFVHASRDPSKLEERGLGACETVFSAADKICRENKIRLVIAFAPSKFRVYQPFCKFPNGSVSASWTLSDLPTRLERLVRSISAKLEFVDLTAPLQTATKSGRQTYFADDTHWTPAGHRAAAKAIRDVIQR